MSQWTHVVGCIRVDGLPKIIEEHKIENIEKILGPMCLFDKWNDESTLPRGSEGSLQYQIIEYYHGMPWVVIPIWGDLRDFDNPKIIQSWWNKTISKLDSTATIRDAVIYLEVEGEKSLILTHET